MSDKSPLVTVITITRTRPQLLQRALAAVARQLPYVPLEHRVLIDACPETAAMMAARAPEPHLTWRVLSRAPHEHSGPGRSSSMRNIGVAEARGEWVAFIDDDNDWEDGHLRSLVALAGSGGMPAVHSAMQVFHSDGRPYAENRVPWERDVKRAEEAFRELVASGVTRFGSNIFLDRADPPGTPSAVQTVDTGEWLIRRDLLLTVPFTTDFGDTDAAGLIGEDDKLMADILAAGIRPLSTRQPTLRYFVGGYSNNFETAFDDTFSWQTKADRP